MSNRTDYMREYMRKKRGSKASRTAPDWLSTLRHRYAVFLRAQSAVSSYRSDAMRTGDDHPEPPAHVLEALAAAESALDAHAAQHPALAHEYYERHAADALRRDADRLALRIAKAKAPRPRGRPTDLPAQLARAKDAAAVTRAERALAYAAYESALANPAALSPIDATRVQSRWDRAKERDEQAAALVQDLQRRVQAHQQAAAQQQADTTGDLQQLAEIRAQIARILAPLPDPPRAPLHPPRRAHDLTASQRRAQRRIAPLDAAALSVLTTRYELVTTDTGERYLRRRASGVRVRAQTVRVPGGASVRTLDLLEALAPSGLV